MCKLNTLHIKLAVLTHFILDSVRLEVLIALNIKNPGL